MQPLQGVGVAIFLGFAALMFTIHYYAKKELNEDEAFESGLEPALTR